MLTLSYFLHLFPARPLQLSALELLISSSEEKQVHGTLSPKSSDPAWPCPSRSQVGIPSPSPPGNQSQTQTICPSRPHTLLAGWGLPDMAAQGPYQPTSSLHRHKQRTAHTDVGGTLLDTWAQAGSLSSWTYPNMSHFNCQKSDKFPPLLLHSLQV